MKSNIKQLSPAQPHQQPVAGKTNIGKKIANVQLPQVQTEAHLGVRYAFWHVPDHLMRRRLLAQLEPSNRQLSRRRPRKS